MDVISEVFEPRKGVFSGASVISGSKETVQTDEDGFFAFDLPIAADLIPSTAEYRITIPMASFEKVFAAEDLGDGGAIRLADI